MNSINYIHDYIRRVRRRLKGTVELRNLYQIIFEDDDMAVLYEDGSGLDLIISFTGVGHSTGGIDLQTPEFSKSGCNNPTIYVIDKRRSWGNSLDWAELERIVKDMRHYQRLVLIGNSMGGFLAVLAARQLMADVVVAFVPQWSISPNIVPFETRWMNHRKRIASFHYPSLENCFSNRCRFYIFCGSNENDLRHLKMFPKDIKNLHCYQLFGGGHSVALLLKEAGILYDVILGCIEGHDLEDLFLTHSCVYQKS